MTETSYFWGGTTIGDHGLYTDNQFSDFIRAILLRDRAIEGVLEDQGDELAVTNPGGVTIRVDDGDAIVDGKWYHSNTNVDHTVVAPGAGTNYYTIVLKKDFAAQTVRQESLGPSSVGYPAVTQVDGTTWEIEIARVSITSGGVITITDTRSFCHFSTNVSTEMIDDEAVTTDKLDDEAVTNEKIADATIQNDKLATPNPTDGWIPVDEAWVYASATTITVPAGAASRFQKGDMWKLTANSVVLMGYVVNVADTLLTVIGDALTAHAFSSIYFSRSLLPFGFDDWFAYTPTGPTNTTMSGRFRIKGRAVEFELYGIATDAVDWTNMPTLPVTPSLPIGGFLQTLIGTYDDFETAIRYGKVSGMISNGVARITLYNGDQEGHMTPFSATSPMTWRAQDEWYINGSYEF